eukprot:TRINITY_DN6324_c0_g1_i1.p1 TRINITY_DN6324_c0_g1~~TRINITY_DN6324_c0_g1_i1.p1  ORF type:complete len:281 (+),score=54.74 TRINITY_DN6324_c0_g1_i1:68-844(+)
MLVRGTSGLISTMGLPSTMLFRASVVTPLWCSTTGLFGVKFQAMKDTKNSNHQQQQRSLSSAISLLSCNKLTSNSVTILSTSVVSTPLLIQQSRRGLRFAGRPKPNPTRASPVADSLGKLPFQGMLLNPPPIIPRNRDQWMRFKIYLAQQLRHFRFMFEEFGFSVRKARAFKAEAADLYTKYLKALAAQDLTKLGLLIPPERIFDYKRVIVQQGIERDLKLLSDVGPLKIVHANHIKGVGFNGDDDSLAQQHTTLSTY